VTRQGCPGAVEGRLQRGSGDSLSRPRVRRIDLQAYLQAHRARLADYRHDGVKHHHVKQAGQLRDQATA
jgi:hypothetical protein